MNPRISALSPRAAAYVVRLAVEKRLVSAAQAKACEDDAAKPGSAGNVAALLVGGGHLREADVLRLLDDQTTKIRATMHSVPTMDRHIGAILIGAGAVKVSQLEAALAEQAKERAAGTTPVSRLGEILVGRGFCTRDQVLAALEEQKKVILICSLCGTRYAQAGYQAGTAYACKACGEPLVRPETRPGV